MGILAIILLALAGIVLLLLIAGLFMTRKHYVRREIVIDAPLQKVFDYVKLLRNQDQFNEGAMAGNDRQRSYHGTDGTVGFIYSWNGDKDAGQGEKEIKKIEEGTRVEMEIRFLKPMSVTSYIVLETEALPDDRTRLYWSNAGTLNYPVNVMIPLLERTLPKGMDRSLAKLKEILEERE